MHEKEKRQYTDDLVTYGDLAWKLWEYRHISFLSLGWYSLVEPPKWNKMYSYRRKEEKRRMVEMKQEGYDYCESRTEVPFQPEYFSGLNWRDAEKLVGKLVRVSHEEAYWHGPFILSEIHQEPKHLCRFKCGHCHYPYICTCPETFAEKTVTITVNGKDYELPMPETEPLKIGDGYWLLEPQEPDLYVWEGTENDYALIEECLIHRERENAQKWVDALDEIWNELVVERLKK